MPIPKLNDICNTSAADNQDILQLFEDKCFKIASKKDITGSFCLEDFAFPVDSHTCVNFDLGIDGEELVIFDNEILTLGSPALDLTSGKNYARGVLINIEYPVNDTNGEEIDIVDKNVELWIEDVETLQYKKYPLYTLFTMFTNPKSNDPRNLINRIKIVNPNLLYGIKVIGMVIYGTAE